MKQFKLMNKCSKLLRELLMFMALLYPMSQDLIRNLIISLRSQSLISSLNEICLNILNLLKKLIILISLCEKKYTILVRYCQTIQLRMPTRISYLILKIYTFIIKISYWFQESSLFLIFSDDLILFKSFLMKISSQC